MYGPNVAILLTYGSHDERHVDFRGLTVVNETPLFWGVTEDFPKNFLGEWSNSSSRRLTHDYFGELPSNSPRRVLQYIYRNSVVSFREQKPFCFENCILLAFSLGMCEGVGEDSRHGIGHVDIQVGSCICLSVIGCHDLCS